MKEDLINILKYKLEWKSGCISQDRIDFLQQQTTSKILVASNNEVLSCFYSVSIVGSLGVLFFFFFKDFIYLFIETQLERERQRHR